MVGEREMSIFDAQSAKWIAQNVHIGCGKK
jgi:hypothetical protein